MITLTRTLIRFTQGDKVVREIVVEPWETPEGKIRVLPIDEKAAYIVHLIETGNIDGAAGALSLPPYLKLFVPPATGFGELERFRLFQAVKQALDPSWRRSMLLRYLEAVRDDVIEWAASIGIDRGVAEQALDALAREVSGLQTLEEVMNYERIDPWNYVASFARARGVRI